MDLEKIKRRNSEKKDVVVSIRLTKSQSKWLREKDYSLNGIFHEALKDLQKVNKE